MTAENDAGTKELLPLSDWRSTAPHTADQCGLELCSSCGCCCHGKPQANGCPMDDAPIGSQCGSAFSEGCACEGRSGLFGGRA